MIHPVILSGGAGTRLWPVSRASFPKQFLALAGEETLLQQTARRLVGKGFTAPIVVCNHEHRFIVAEQLRSMGFRPEALLLEPVARGTLAAAVAAARLVFDTDPEGLMFVAPADHAIADGSAFHVALARAAAAARAGLPTAFGITPDHPETGYGYIQPGTAVADLEGVKDLIRFVEKPDAARAAEFLASGYLWNSGMFLFPVRQFLEAVARFEPDVLSAVTGAVESAERDGDFMRLGEVDFWQAPSQSIDSGVMERLERAAVVPASMGWSDVGAWSALWDIGAKDGAGNVVSGPVAAVEVQNSYVRSDGPVTAVLGLNDVVVVTTEDAVLVAARDRVQDVRKVVDSLKAMGREEHEAHLTVYRPWGRYRRIDKGDRFQVKQITVEPGGRLSLQLHHHRAEHWIVVQGTAMVTSGEKSFLLRENESTFIPAGTKHRLENPGRIPLRLIEVQSGTYLGEDDIIRFDDVYGRG